MEKWIVGKLQIHGVRTYLGFVEASASRLWGTVNIWITNTGKIEEYSQDEVKEIVQLIENAPQLQADNKRLRELLKEVVKAINAPKNKLAAIELLEGQIKTALNSTQ